MKNQYPKSRYSSTFFCGDLHLGDHRILKYRQEFPDIETHDRTILENIKTRGSKRNVLWLMGDCFPSIESLEHLKEISKWFKQVNLCIGNHDTENIEHSRALAKLHVDGVIHRLVSLYNYKGFLLSHAPVHPDELRGKINVHAHTHSRVIDDPRYISVSLEQIYYYPMQLNNIKDYLEYGDFLISRIENER